MSALSLTKLVAMLEEKDFVPTAYYRYEGSCILVEVTCLSLGVTCMVYIPSRFVIPISQGETVFETEVVEPPNEEERAGKYKELDMKGTTLTDYRSHGIDVHRGEKGSRENLVSIVKQLERLQYTVKDLAYDLLIIDGDHFGYIREGECDCYRIIRKNYSTSRKLRVVLELPRFFKTGERMGVDCLTIYEGIQKAVSSNLEKNTEYFDRMMASLRSRTSSSTFQDMWGRVSQRTKVLESYKELLKNLDDEQHILKNRISRLSNEGPGTREERIRKEDCKRLRKCLDLKREVVLGIQFLREDIDKIIFPMERALFENADMLQKLVSNLDLLSSLQNQTI